MSTQHRCRGFSLLELQVVVGLLLLLLAMLLPAVGSVRERGRAVACAASMRQIGLLLQVYSTSNQDWALRDEAHPLTGLSTSWVRTTRALLGHNDPPDAQYPFLLPPVRAMICPSNPLQDVPTTYLANAMHFTDHGATGAFTILMTKRNHIRNPSNVPYLLESRTLFYQSIQSEGELNGVYYAAFHDVWHTNQYHEARAARMTLTRHGASGSNALMFDGSVRHLTVADWTDRTLDDGVRDSRWVYRVPRVEPP